MHRLTLRHSCDAIAAVVVLLVAVGSSAAVDIERPPIRYSQTAPDNPVSQLQRRIDDQKAELRFNDKTGYLPAVLMALDLPVSSQTLVFSKTSLQRQRIAPQTPRAIYFNDDCYVGYCQDGELMELSVADPQLGTVYYTLSQQESARPQFSRQTDNCLLCHGSSHTEGMPGHLVRSVFVDRSGLPELSMGSYRTDHTSPLEQRWGGWYVTGTHGQQRHLGNLVLQGRADRDDAESNTAGLNVTDLKGRFDTSAYLSPHSDLVALMVLEHQTAMHNRIVQAALGTRAALYDEAKLNQELGEPADHRWDSTRSRIRSVAEPLVEHLLFAEEAKLDARLKGTSGFAAEFAARGPRDRLGRSLRDFDLARRIFKYPCSYLIYSASFDALPEEALEYIWRRLWEILHDGSADKAYSHLSPADRREILEILRDTKPNLPSYWHDNP